MPQSDILRIIMQSLLIIFNSPVKFALTDSGKATNLISTYHKRIALDSRITVCFRTLKIFQIQFGQSPEKIRLIQIRFSVNYLVEVLNGKYIILKIKSVSGDSHHPIRIYLSTYQCGEQ